MLLLHFLQVVGLVVAAVAYFAYHLEMSVFIIAPLAILAAALLYAPQLSDD